MKAVGQIRHNTKSATGHKLVNLYIDDLMDVSFCLANEDEIPLNANSYFGLFEYEPSDQFCKWIDPNK